MGPTFDAPGPEAYMMDPQNHAIKKLIVSSKAPPDTCMRQVVNVLGGDRIATLHIFCHGDSGYLELGQGLPMEYVSGGGANFERLKGHFSWPEGVIKIYGCGLASDTITHLHDTTADPKNNLDANIPGTFSRPPNGRGYWFCKGAANAAGVPVQAGIDPVNGCAPYFTFKGQRTLYVYPDVAVRKDPRIDVADYVVICYGLDGKPADNRWSGANLMRLR
jgi:hypothetical protein